MRLHTVQTLVLPLFVYIIKVAKHFDCCDVRSGIIYNTLAPVLDQVFEQLEGLGTRIRPALSEN